ncbi:hypothetical protein B296_00046296 [Ensete ventricosum]|uniref:Uncharacterized protein n=1 Tax=Ensete ventricosum TaxID=4639 RepID=A0A426XIY8_ENSVE|nr:hypothetical protein B296_00046296 [Ensete ventricosum]
MLIVRGRTPVSRDCHRRNYLPSGSDQYHPPFNASLRFPSPSARPPTGYSLQHALRCFAPSHPIPPRLHLAYPPSSDRDRDRDRSLRLVRIGGFTPLDLSPIQVLSLILNLWRRRLRRSPRVARGRGQDSPPPPTQTSPAPLRSARSAAPCRPTPPPALPSSPRLSPHLSRRPPVPAIPNSPPARLLRPFRRAWSPVTGLRALPRRGSPLLLMPSRRRRLALRRQSGLPLRRLRLPRLRLFVRFPGARLPLLHRGRSQVHRLRSNSADRQSRTPCPDPRPRSRPSGDHRPCSRRSLDHSQPWPDRPPRSYLSTGHPHRSNLVDHPRSRRSPDRQFHSRIWAPSRMQDGHPRHHMSVHHLRSHSQGLLLWAPLQALQLQLGHRNRSK